MKTIDIDNMVAGRAMDALVAEHVIKLDHVGKYYRILEKILDKYDHYTWYHDWMEGTTNLKKSKRKIIDSNPNSTELMYWGDGEPLYVQFYSLDIISAWRAVDKMRGQGWAFQLVDTGVVDYTCRLRRGEAQFFGVSSDAPLAICKAALKAAMDA